MIKKIIETKQVLITLTALIMLSVTSAISANDDGVESVTIIGSKDDARNLAGSGTVLSEEDLNKIVDTDIHKIQTIMSDIINHIRRRGDLLESVSTTLMIRGETRRQES